MRVEDAFQFLVQKPGVVGEVGYEKLRLLPLLDDVQQARFHPVVIGRQGVMTAVSITVR